MLGLSRQSLPGLLGCSAAGVAVAVALSACGASASKSTSPTTGASGDKAATALPAGFTAHGFATVAASGTAGPSTPLVLRSGDITVSVPGTALPARSTVQLLEGSNHYWQSYAPKGQKVVAAFAFRVVNQATNALVISFSAPIVVKVSSPEITHNSKYLNTAPSVPPSVSANPVPPKITGTTLAHGNIADGVGWLVTSPSG